MSQVSGLEKQKELENLFYEGLDLSLHKWKHYPKIYDRHFSKFRNQPVNILEIGVQNGGSLQMWLKYFGVHATIWGIDIDPACKELEYGSDQIHIRIGDQKDPIFLENLIKESGTFDIIIDDGSHMSSDMIRSFEILYGGLNPHGVYLVEDTHTCYLPSFGAGLRDPRSFIEYTKNLIDQLHGWHVRALELNSFTKQTYSMHFYDSVVVLEKKCQTLYEQMPISEIRSGLTIQSTPLRALRY